MQTILASLIMLSFSLTAFPQAAYAQPADDLLTVAEQSEYTRSASYAEVVDLMDRIASRSNTVRRASLGETHEGRSIPLAILADPPVETAQEARESGRPIVFAFANIHAGEVCGKEALLQLMREIVLDPQSDLLDDLIIIFAPIYNADGNERFAAVERNRPGQQGPEEVGIRRNAQGLDLNRDYIKLEAPETRALVRLLSELDPHVTIDCHTTNGSFHRYTLTYAAPQNPSGPAEPIEFVRDRLLPTVTDRLRERTGYETFFYGNFNREMTQWITYSHQPRFGCPYRGLRGRMSVLSEAYAYAPFKDRVICTREFVREILHFTAEHRDEIIRIHNRATVRTMAAGRNPQPDDVIGLRYEHAAFPELIEIKGWELESDDGNGRRRRARPTDIPRDYPVVHLGRFEPLLSVTRPHAYIVESGLDGLIEKLARHGIRVEPYDGRPVMTETYTITGIEQSRRPFEGHTMNTLEVQAERMRRNDFGSDAHLVSTAQPLGNLIVYLLEPQSDDGFAAWGLFGDRLVEGGRYPVARVRSAEDLE